jgi:hypothetical protein
MMTRITSVVRSCKMFGWGPVYTLQAFPPDPAIVGPRWREMWKMRCEAIDFPVANWVEHRARRFLEARSGKRSGGNRVRYMQSALGGCVAIRLNSALDGTSSQRRRR